MCSVKLLVLSAFSVDQALGDRMNGAPNANVAPKLLAADISPHIFIASSAQPSPPSQPAPRTQPAQIAKGEPLVMVDVVAPLLAQLAAQPALLIAALPETSTNPVAAQPSVTPPATLQQAQPAVLQVQSVPQLEAQKAGVVPTVAAMRSGDMEASAALASTTHPINSPSMNTLTASAQAARVAPPVSVETTGGQPTPQLALTAVKLKVLSNAVAETSLHASQPIVLLIRNSAQPVAPAVGVGQLVAAKSLVMPASVLPQPPSVAAVIPGAPTLPQIAATGTPPTSGANLGAFPAPSDLAPPLLVASRLSMAWTALIHSAGFLLFIKGACMISNVVFQVSPLPQVQQWISQSNTGEADAGPFLAIALGGWQWCFYGVFAWLVTQRSGFLILVHSNFLGALLGTYYALTFKQHCRNACALDSLWLYGRAAFCLVVFQLFAMLALPIQRSLFMAGIIASLCSVASGLSVLISVPTVLRTKKSDSIPGALVFSSFVSACMWFVCGIMLADPCILMPNTVTIAACSICLFLKVKYWEGHAAKPPQHQNVLVTQFKTCQFLDAPLKLAGASVEAFHPEVMDAAPGVVDALQLSQGPKVCFAGGFASQAELQDVVGNHGGTGEMC